MVTSAMTSRHPSWRSWLWPGYI